MPMGVFTFQCEIKKQNLHCVCLEFKPCFQNLLPSKQMLNIYFDKTEPRRIEFNCTIRKWNKEEFSFNKAQMKSTSINFFVCALIVK